MAKKKISTKNLKIKKGVWFVPLRSSYIPCSWQGWLTYIPFSLYIIIAMYVGFVVTTSTSAAILFILANWVAAAAFMTWLAKRKS